MSITSGTELKRFRKGFLPKVSIAVLLVIPLIYGALYLWAFWAPDEHMNELPVAVVNLDEPAETSDGDTLSAGADVLTELLDGKDLDWRVLDADAAKQQVADGDVYFAVTIPRDFSATLAGLDDDPRAGEIVVTYNDNNSFLASTLGRQAMSQLREAVAETATETAADTVLVGVQKLSDGTRDAAEAAGTLSDGTITLHEATESLETGLGTLAEGTSELAAKAPELSSGAQTLASGLATAHDATSRLADGAASLAGGSATVSDGVTTLAAGVDELAANAGLLSEASVTLDQKTGALVSGSQQVALGTQTIAQLAVQNPDLTLAQLDGLMQQQGVSLQVLAGGAQQVADGAAQFQGGTQALSGKLGAFAEAAHAATVKTPELVAGAQAVAAGASDLSAGAAELTGGTAQLSNGAGQLASGASALSQGAAQLGAGAATARDGAGELAEGAGTLASGASEFHEKLAEGAAEAPDFTDEHVSKMSSTIAKPVVLDENTENEVQGFGEGFAPFFIALATFVGALITWLILRAMPRRPLGSNTSGFRTVMTGLWPATLIGVGQSLIMMAVLVWGIGMQPKHPGAMLGFMLLVTLAFLALQQMFIIIFGTATGRVISLVLLMLQLSSSGGTYPVETTPVFFQILHPFMPASYVVDGLRQLIGGGIDSRFWVSLAVMAGVLVVSVVLSSIAARKQKVWTVSRLHPALAI